jgi:hypothetical protein
MLQSSSHDRWTTENEDLSTVPRRRRRAKRIERNTTATLKIYMKKLENHEKRYGRKINKQQLRDSLLGVVAKQKQWSVIQVNSKLLVVFYYFYIFFLLELFDTRSNTDLKYGGKFANSSLTWSQLSRFSIETVSFRNEHWAISLSVDSCQCSTSLCCKWI